MNSEQFIYALTSEGYKLTKSNGLDKLITPQTVKYILAKCKEYTPPNQVTILFFDEQVLSVSYLTVARDNFGREGTCNHTFIVGIEDYISFTDPAKIFSLEKQLEVK